jgi:hypothetical protein
MSKPRREGYLLIDHRYSPGVTEEFVRNSGVEGGTAVPGGVTFESATVTCLHCNGVVILSPTRKRPRGYCARCDGYVCDRPACGLECRSFEKLVDKLQEQYAKHVCAFVGGRCYGCGAAEATPWEESARALFGTVVAPAG